MAPKDEIYSGNWRSDLIALFKKYDEEELSSVEDLLTQWAGKEKSLLKKLKYKYQNAEATRIQREDCEATVKALKQLYKEKIRPLEEMYQFDLFFSPYLEDVDFDAKPMVLLLGQYSVGKTTFIKHLIGRDFPGIRIGPEPTTERFIVVSKGNDDQTIPGNALVVAADQPFRTMTQFGTQFLNRFEASMCNAKLLDDIVLVDTPGVLSGEKQRIGRNYDFTKVIEWFAERSDRIVLLFDAHKLDVSDEFKRSIMALHGHEDKIRIVLNKADSVNASALMRVYGSLMWSLGKVFTTPEVLRVYIGSFWDQPLDPEHDNYNLFQSEHQDLMGDLRSLPRNSAIRKVNELVKRARLAKVHAVIMSELKQQMPSFFGKSKKQQQILNDLPQMFQRIATKHRVPIGDLPDINRFKATLADLNLSKFPILKEKVMKKVETVLSIDIPNLMRDMRNPVVSSSQETDAVNPFSMEPMTGNATEWAVTAPQKTEADNRFQALPKSNGLLSGPSAKEAFAGYGMTNQQLFEIWSLADVNKNNQLSADEFAVAVHLVHLVKGGVKLPKLLPPELVPPSMRGDEVV